MFFDKISLILAGRQVKSGVSCSPHVKFWPLGPYYDLEISGLWGPSIMPNILNSRTLLWSRIFVTFRPYCNPKILNPGAWPNSLSFGTLVWSGIFLTFWPYYNPKYSELWALTLWSRIFWLLWLICRPHLDLILLFIISGSCEKPLIISLQSMALGQTDILLCFFLAWPPWWKKYI